MDEVLDIVDEQDNVIGSVPKKEAHQKGLLHRCVIGGVMRSSGKIVLVKQTSDRQDAGQLVSPIGGHVKAGESVEDALKREAEEELGLKYFEFKLVGKKIFNRNVLGRVENHYFIIYEVYTDETFNLGSEAEDYLEFTKGELKGELKSNPQRFGDAYHFVIKFFYSELLN